MWLTLNKLTSVVCFYTSYISTYMDVVNTYFSPFLRQKKNKSMYNYILWKVVNILSTKCRSVTVMYCKLISISVINAYVSENAVYNNCETVQDFIHMFEVPKKFIL